VGVVDRTTVLHLGVYVRFSLPMSEGTAMKRGECRTACILMIVGFYFNVILLMKKTFGKYLSKFFIL
jgi:hypothetical protein